jgi:hypothetical protein
MYQKTAHFIFRFIKSHSEANIPIDEAEKLKKVLIALLFG